MEFSYYGAPAATPKEEFYTELVDRLRGSDPCIGSGSQVIILHEHSSLALAFFNLDLGFSGIKFLILEFGFCGSS